MDIHQPVDVIRQPEEVLTEIDELRLSFTDAESLVLCPVESFPPKIEGDGNSNLKLCKRCEVYNQNGQVVLYFARSESEDEYIIFNPNGRQILNINSRFEVRSGHFNMGVIYENKILGYTIFDGIINGKKLVHIRNPLSIFYLHHLIRLSKSFNIIMPEDGKIIGKIGNNITKSDGKLKKSFGTSFPLNMQPQTKALIFGSSFLILHQFFKGSIQ